jgi:glycosyltransferase involved in cell wall biosynthesis
MDACLQILPGHDVVLERNSLYTVAVARACKKLHLPYIVFFDADQIAELEFIGKPLKGILLWRARNLLRENLQIARKVICVSTAARNHLITKWHVPAGKILVLPNGVDVSRFCPDEKRRAEVRRALQLLDNPLVIFVGGFYPWHDVVTLLDAFGRILPTTPNARLVLVGEGPGQGAIWNHTKKNGIDQAVHFTGRVEHEQVASYINAADIAVVPIPVMKQDFWLSPMKLFEYMAAGKAMVASAMGQIVQIVKHGENGLLVPAGDAGALAEALHLLLSDAELRARLGRQARSHAVRHHSWDRYLSELESALQTSVSLYRSQ